ncbi:MAG: type II toxin-antitoxin system VapC family toxin [Caldilineales bacterium]|nr:type II toxin-antitoxin system VapC family toxin [Caldilineales bacterium]
MTAMKPRVYLETSIISYLAARISRNILVAANQQVTQEWWETRRLKFDLFISSAVVNEISRGNPEMAAQRLKIVEGIPILPVEEKALLLAEKLVERQAVPQKSVEDALHMAIATAEGMEYLLTWNLRHIANAAMRKRIEQVCRDHGYEPPIMCSPQELMEV